jgi:hypothetical protein
VFATLAITSLASGVLVTTQGWTWLNLGSLLPPDRRGAGLACTGSPQGTEYLRAFRLASFIT